MFEDSLFSSRNSFANHREFKRTRWTVLASAAAQALLLAGAFGIPLLWPATLPVVSAAPRAASIAFSRPEPTPSKPVKPIPIHISNQTAMRAPSSRVAAVMTSAHGGVIARPAAPASGDEPPALALGGPMTSPFAFGTGPVGAVQASASRVVAGPVRSSSPVRVSSGVSTGMLLTPIVPVYPRIAIAARQEGTVQLTATIDRSGHIVGLHVVSGPEMLRTAALEAVQTARYRPYTLNGEATEVVTTITVTFRLNGAT